MDSVCLHQQVFEYKFSACITSEMIMKYWCKVDWNIYNAPYGLPKCIAIEIYHFSLLFSYFVLNESWLILDIDSDHCTFCHVSPNYAIFFPNRNSFDTFQLFFMCVFFWLFIQHRVKCLYPKFESSLVDLNKQTTHFCLQMMLTVFVT